VGGLCFLRLRLFCVKEEKSSAAANSLGLQNKMAEESSKEEEISAICKLRNTSSTASNAEKLKALDMEYQHLRDTNQHIKAEHIQALYQYKAKKIISVRALVYFLAMRINKLNTFLCS
jgi:hypothetical protein